MNEEKDILFASAKLVSLNNPWASIATHAVSSAYNAEDTETMSIEEAREMKESSRACPGIS